MVVGLYINCLNEDYRLSKLLTDALTANVERILEEYNLSGGEVGLILVDDRYIRSLNKQYRDKDAPTDVLSFSFLEPDSADSAGDKEFAVGDIYVSVDRARGQALDAGHSLEREIILLAVHGLLHLLGYDHEEEEEKQLMQNKEREIIERFDF